MSESHTLIFRFPPKVKQRPRMTRRGRVFTPQGTIDFEEAVREAWTESGLPTTEGPCRVIIRLRPKGFTVTVTPLDGFKSTARGDVDNYAKAILDGLQREGGAFNDDKQVIELTISKKGKL